MICGDDMHIKTGKEIRSSVDIKFRRQLEVKDKIIEEFTNKIKGAEETVNKTREEADKVKEESKKEIELIQEKCRKEIE